MAIEDIISKAEILDPDRQYWFFRTEGGRFFEEFYEKNFIAIGWNLITVDDLKNQKKERVREKIAKNYKIDASNSKGKSSVSVIYNQIEKFNNLKKGDVVIIPSYSSSRLAFGIIDDNATYIDNKVSENKGCEFNKRRKVNWLKIKQTSLLDAKLYQMISGRRQTISNLNDYASYIDNVTNNLFFKADAAYFVVDIKQNEDINIKSLVSFIDSIQILANKVNEHFDLKEDIDASSIKLNLQSPGLINFKFPSGKTLVVLASILAASCSSNNNHSQEVDNFIKVNTPAIDSIHQSRIELKADFDEINN